MRFETTPDCICGGTASLPWPDRAPDDLLSSRPCPECIDRYNRTHCARCDTRVGDGGCDAGNGTKLCELCMSLRPAPAEDFRALVLRRRAAIAAKRAAVNEFNRCRSAFDREAYVAAVAAMRAASQEETAALAAIDAS